MSKFVVCLNNASNPASLIVGKVYRTLPDADAESLHMLRVVDQDKSEPDGYLYPDSIFAPMKQGFPPLIDEKSRVLILGTMPGEESLRREEYYANPRNQFWRIMAEIYHVELGASYSERKTLLLLQKLALWDVIESCERSGSLDKAIRGAVPNDFKMFFQSYPNLQAIVFNGQKAHEWFERWVVRQQALAHIENISKLILPSTSPAATISFLEKVRQWSKIIQL